MIIESFSRNLFKICTQVLMHRGCAGVKSPSQQVKLHANVCIGRERRRFGMTVYWNQGRSLDWIVTDKKGDQIN